MDETPKPYSTGRDNQVGRRTSTPKLNGRVYTPDALARRVVDALPMTEGARWLDPACGDGAFLAAVLDRALHERVRGVHVIGWDIDGDALTAASRRLAPLAEEAGARLTLIHRDALDATDDRFDIIVGNPPYLESKRMPDALKRHLRGGGWVSAAGAFDLYAVFVELASRLLAPNGRFALIVPNRLLVTVATAALREALLTGGSVSVEDRSAEGDFGSAAAVYPVVLSWWAGGPPVLRTPGVADAFAAEEVRDRLGGRWVVPWPGAGGALLRRVLRADLRPLDACFEVRWTVSFHRAGLRTRFVSDVRPASPFARRFLGGAAYSGNRELDHGRVEWVGGWIDYDELRARAEGNAFPPVAMFDAAKVVVAQNARRCRAALDRSGLVLKDTFLLVRTRPGIDGDLWLPWLVLVLQSDVFHVLYAQLFAGTRKAGGYLHFLGSYLSGVPIPAPPSSDWSALTTDGGAADPAAAEALVRAAYGVSAEEGTWLDEAAGVAWPRPC